MSRILMVSFFVILFAFICRTPSFAGNNISVTCTNAKCTINTTKPFFSEVNWQPTSKASQTITVINKRADTCDLIVKAKNPTQTPLYLADQLETSIKRNNQYVYGQVHGQNNGNEKTIYDFFVSQGISFGLIQPKSTAVYTWAVTFMPQAGNLYQKGNVKYNFDLVFTCASNIGSPEFDEDTSLLNQFKQSNLVTNNETPNDLDLYVDTESGAQWNSDPTEYQAKIIRVNEDENVNNPRVLGANTLKSIYFGDGKIPNQNCSDNFLWGIIFVIQAIIFLLVAIVIIGLPKSKTSIFYFALMPITALIITIAIKMMIC